MTSIRASFLLFVSLAVVCGNYAAAAPLDDRADRAVAEIEKVGGSVGYDDSRPEAPAVSVVFRGSQVNDAVLSHLRALPGLLFVQIEHAPISDAGITARSNEDHR